MVAELLRQRGVGDDIRRTTCDCAIVLGAGIVVLLIAGVVDQNTKPMGLAIFLLLPLSFCAWALYDTRTSGRAGKTDDSAV